MSASAAGPDSAPAPWDIDDDAPEPARPARHDAFTPGRRRIFLKHLAKTGCIADAARLTGVAPRTVYNHQDKDAEFARHCELAARMAAGGIEQIAYERAVTGVSEQFACGGQVHTRTRYSDGLLRLLLQATNPNKYGARPGFTRKRLVKAERKLMRREIRAELRAEQAPKKPTQQERIESIMRKVDRIRAGENQKRRETGWIETEDGDWIPPGWVRDPLHVPPAAESGGEDTPRDSL